MKKILALLLALVMIFALAACGEASTDTSNPPADGDTPASEAPADGGDTTVANKDKPLVWFNRQPSNSTTG